MKEVSEMATKSIGWMTQNTPLEDKSPMITDTALSFWGIVNLYKKSEYMRVEVNLRVWIQKEEDTMISVPTQNIF